MSLAPLELIPELDDAVIDALRSGCHQASRLRAVIAFWTLRPEIIGPDLVRSLSGDGFMCVDIHSPTNIDLLADLRRAGANIYLHLFDLAGQTEVPGTKGVPPYLLHAKTLLFDRTAREAELWVGSHNWTQRSLFGVNIEASLRVGVTPGASSYAQAVDFLEGARDRCQLLDPSLVPYYKWLQGDDNARNVIELEDRTGGPVVASPLTLFGSHESEYGQLKKVDNEVIVAITESRTGHERFYRSKIVTSGKLRDRAGKGLAWDPRRWAFRNGPSIPVLEPVSAIPKRVVDRAFYFVTLELTERFPDSTEAGEPPDVPRWIDLTEAELRAVVRHGPKELLDEARPRRLRGTNKGYLHVAERLPERAYTGRRGDRPPRVRRAADPELFRVRTRPLEERRAESERPLVTRRIFNTDTE